MAISFCLSVRCGRSPENHALASPIDRSATSLMWRPAILTAFRRRLEAAELLAHPARVGLVIAPLHVGDDALERPLDGVGALVVRVDHLDRLVAGAVQDDVAGLFRQVGERRVDRELEGAGERIEGLVVVARRRAGPRRDRALLQRPGRVRDDQLGIEIHLGAEPVAGRAGAVRVVEREQPRLDLVDGEARHRAGELGREDGALAAVGVLGDGDAVGEAERGFQRIREPVAHLAAHDQAVDHHLDVVLVVLVERGNVLDAVHLAVDADAGEALLLEVGELAPVLALAAAHDGREQVEPGSLGHRLHPVDHLRDGLALDGQPGGRRVGDADARIEDAHVVVDLGDRADRRARVARGRLLLDGDRRRQALDRIDVGLFHQLEKLAGIGRQALDVAALAFGVDGVEGERRLARAGQPGDHHQRLARELDVYVLQIMLAGAANDDLGLHRYGIRPIKLHGLNG